MTSRSDITRRLALAASAAAGGLATAAFFLLRRPYTAGDYSSGGGFTALAEWPQAVYPLVNDDLIESLHREYSGCTRAAHS